MLKKLSLAALVAMGSISFASATPLTEAIKNVNLNGYMRLRYYHESNKNDSTKHKTDTSYNYWRTNAKLVFTLPIDETLSFTYRVNAQTVVEDQSTKNVDTEKTGLTDSLFFLKYHKDALTAMGGVIPLNAASIVSNDSYTTGNGPAVLALYNVGNGLTVGGAYIDTLFNAKEVGGTLSNDVYALTALYSDKEVGSVKVWGYHVTDLLKYDVTLQASLKIPGAEGVSVNLAYGNSKLEDNAILNGDQLFAGSAPSAHQFYQAEVVANVNGFGVTAGYAKTNKKDGVLVTSSDATFGAIPMETRDNLANETDVKAYYAKVSAKPMDKTSVFAAYAKVDQGKDAGNIDSDEYDVGGSYKYNKKLTFSGYYAYINYNNDGEAAGKDDNGELKLEALYKF